MDWYIIITPLLLLPMVALLKFVGCDRVLGLDRPDAGTLRIAPAMARLKATQTQTFTAVTSWPDPEVAWSVSSVSATPGTITQQGDYTAPPEVLTPYSEEVVASAADPNGYTIEARALVNLETGNSANFVRFDDLTQGSWHGTYGADGYVLAHQPPAVMLPNYLPSLITPPQIYPFADPSSEQRALQTPDNLSRYAYVWFDANGFNFALNFTDTLTHQVAVYCVDWNEAREQTFTMFDGDISTQLDTQSIAGFANGTYLVWLVSGRVRLEVKHTRADGTPGGGSNAVVSGIFFR